MLFYSNYSFSFLAVLLEFGEYVGDPGLYDGDVGEYDGDVGE